MSKNISYNKSKLSVMAKKETDLSQSHSIEEAEELHVAKYKD